MPWHAVTWGDIGAAIDEADGTTREHFRVLHGDFYEAHGVLMQRPGMPPGGPKQYEARPLLAAAYAHLHPGARLNPNDFHGMNGHEFLEQHFGFTPVAI